MLKHKNKIIWGSVIIIILAFVFWYGGDAPGLRGFSIEPEKDITAVYNTKEEKTEAPISIDELLPIPRSKENPSENTPNPEPTVTEAPIVPEDEVMPEAATLPEGQPMEAETPKSTTQVAKIQNGDTEYSKSQGMEIDEDTGKDKYMTDPVPEGMPLPVGPENVVISDKENTCILSVKCDTILNNIEWLDKAKADIIPKDGVILPETTVVFYEGESVFNLLLREMKKNKIHLEFENTPIYNSAYIEGISNIYEFDCGELSGWMYKVNDWFPNYGCSRYQLEVGDRVEWVYTCDLGVDVGGYYAAKGEQK